MKILPEETPASVIAKSSIFECIDPDILRLSQSALEQFYRIKKYHSLEILKISDSPIASDSLITNNRLGISDLVERVEYALLQTRDAYQNINNDIFDGINSFNNLATSILSEESLISNFNIIFGGTSDQNMKVQRESLQDLYDISYIMSQTMERLTVAGIDGCKSINGIGSPKHFLPIWEMYEILLSYYPTDAGLDNVFYRKMQPERFFSKLQKIGFVLEQYLGKQIANNFIDWMTNAEFQDFNNWLTNIKHLNGWRSLTFDNFHSLYVEFTGLEFDRMNNAHISRKVEMFTDRSGINHVQKFMDSLIMMSYVLRPLSSVTHVYKWNTVKGKIKMNLEHIRFNSKLMKCANNIAKIFPSLQPLDGTSWYSQRHITRCKNMKSSNLKTWTSIRQDEFLVFKSLENMVLSVFNQFSNLNGFEGQSSSDIVKNMMQYRLFDVYFEDNIHPEYLGCLPLYQPISENSIDEVNGWKREHIQRSTGFPIPLNFRKGTTYIIKSRIYQSGDLTPIRLKVEYSNEFWAIMSALQRINPDISDSDTNYLTKVIIGDTCSAFQNIIAQESLDIHALHSFSDNDLIISRDRINNQRFKIHDILNDPQGYRVVTYTDSDSDNPMSDITEIYIDQGYLDNSRYWEIVEHNGMSTHNIAGDGYIICSNLHAITLRDREHRIPLTIALGVDQGVIGSKAYNTWLHTAQYESDAIIGTEVPLLSHYQFKFITQLMQLANFYTGDSMQIDRMQLLKNLHRIDILSSWGLTIDRMQILMSHIVPEQSFVNVWDQFGVSFYLEKIQNCYGLTVRPSDGEASVPINSPFYLWHVDYSDRTSWFYETFIPGILANPNRE